MSALTDTQRLARIRQLLEAARCLRDAECALGRTARNELPASTGLSSQNIQWALENSLEVDASDAELQRLCARTPTGERAHVLLSANVFVAALRAIAIGLACAPKVFVRASRREPVMAKLLAEAAPGLFELGETLAPLPGDHCWAYGSDSTMRELERSWSQGVVLHANGSGYGVAVLDSSDIGSPAAVELAAARLAIDVAAFDQRGCLSPRVALVEDEPDRVKQFAHALAASMQQREARIPIGALTPTQRAEIRCFHDTMCMAGEVLPAGTGLVTVENERLPWLVPPGGRVLHVRATVDAVSELTEHGAAVTTLGVSTSNTTLAGRLAVALPNARIAQVGRMQCPPLDGPADLRGLPRTVLR